MISQSKKVLLIGGCGYIGSFLYPKLLEEGCSVSVCDSLQRGNPANIDIHYNQYQDIPAADLVNFDSVLWFAGHSSVGQAVSDPNGAMANNCIDLYTFVSKLPKHIKFIYASTGSMYSNKDVATPSHEESLLQIPENNAYDVSKFAFDYIAKNCLNMFYGLRMGTLSGYSPNLRSELVFNAMSLSAYQKGVIHLKNSHSMRTILLLSDLWILVKNLLWFDHQPGFYNAGSISCSMAELAKSIAKTWKSKIIYMGNSNTYSFLLDCTRMDMVCGHELNHCSIESASQIFIDQFVKGT